MRNLRRLDDARVLELLEPTKVEIDLALEGEDSHVVVHVQLKQNLGRQTFVVVNDDECDSAGELAVVQGLRKSHRWAELISSGTYHDRKELANTLGLSNSYLGKVLRLEYLSPRVIEALMLGELPAASITKLMALDTPIWAEQEQKLGLKR